jgi:hypothetical protein
MMQERMGDRIARVTPEYVTGDDMQGRWIHCRKCLMRSYNPNDVDQRYCGRCKVFHEDAVHPGNGHLDRTPVVVEDNDGEL